jgi:nitrogen fixation/metabolism regulation signal transduction histidine kinase
MLSSNMIERLVEGVFRIDVNRAMSSANNLIDYYERKEEELFLKKVESRYPDYFEKRASSRQLIRELYANGTLEHGVDYGAIVERSRIKIETKPLFTGKKLPEFEVRDRGLGYANYVEEKLHIVLFAFPLRESDEFLLIGHRMHPGLEADNRNFSTVYGRLKNESLWKVEIPTNLRLGLGLIYAFMICCALLASIIIARQISLPIVSIAAATRKIADGDLNAKIDISARGEMGVLIDSFNQMTSELKDLQGKLLHTQRMAAWQEVAKRLAHEIKNPLTPIQLSAERILRRLDKPNRGDLSRVLRTGATTIIEQVATLRQMVEEFANFARLPIARTIRGNLDEMISESVHLFRGIPGVSLELSLSGKLPPVELDKNLVIGMINNLVKNAVEAIQHMDSPPSPGRIRITTEVIKQANRNYVSLSVEDNGPGVETGLDEQIFEPYFSTKGEHGSGLGLALVERAVTEHDAKIHVGKSESLGGARFRIMFRVVEG